MKHMNSEDLFWLDQIAEEYASQIRAGANPNLEQYISQRPDLETHIREILGMAGRIESAKIYEAIRAPSLSEPFPSLQGYHIRHELGRGGMGIVFEADDLTLRRRVALKVLAPHLCRDPKSVARFQREARAAGRLQHPNIISIHKVSEQTDEPIYFTMPLIDGIGFDRVIERLRKKTDVAENESLGANHELSEGEMNRSSTSLSVTLQDLHEGRDSTGRLLKSTSRYFQRVAKLGQQIANALAYAHAQGILHRDIKPSNVLLDSNGNAWVSDFGLAKDMDDESTATGDLVGTIRYMAPERFLGKYDARTDIYGLGLILYELVALQPAFSQVDRAQLLDAIQHCPVKDVIHLERRVPKDLNTIIAKCLAYSPASRYATATEVSEDLQRFIDYQPIRAKAVGLFERCYKAALRQPSLTSLIIVLAIAFGFSTVLWKRAEWSRFNENSARERLERLVYARDIEMADMEFQAQNMDQCKRILDRCSPELRKLEWNFLQKRLNPPIWSSPMSSQLISCVALGNHGKDVAFGFGAMGQNSSLPIFVWDTEKDQLLYELKDLFECQVTDLEFSPNGDLLVAACVVWDMDNNSGVNRRGGVRAWNVSDGSLRWSWNKVDAVITHFSSDCNSVFVGSASGPIVELDAVDGHEIRSYSGSRGTLLDMKISPDKKQLAVCTRDGVVSIWNLNEERFSKQIAGMGDTRHLEWSPNQDRLYVSNYLGEQLTIDVRNKSLQLVNIQSHSNRNREVFEASPDHSCIVTACYDRPIEFLDAKRFSVQFQIPAHGGRTRAIAFDDSGRLLATGGADGFVHIWDLTKTDKTKITSPLQKAVPAAIDISPSTGDLAIAMTRRSARAERVSGSPRVEILNAKDFSIKKTFLGHTDWLTTVEYNHLGTQVVSGSLDSTVRVWDADSGTPIATYDGHRGAIRTAAFAKDSTSILSSDEMGSIRRWEAANSKVHWTFECNEELAAVPFFGKKHTIAILKSGKAIVLESADGKLIHEHTFKERVRTAVADDAGNQLAIGTESGKLLFASISELLAKRDPLLGKITAPSEARSLDFNCDGSRLLVGYQDESIRLYDAELHLELLCVESLMGVVMQAMFARRSDNLVVARRYNIVQYQVEAEPEEADSWRMNQIAWHKIRLAWCTAEKLHAASAFHRLHLQRLEPNDQEHGREAIKEFFRAGRWTDAKRELHAFPAASNTAIDDGLLIGLNLILGDRTQARKQLESMQSRFDRLTTLQLQSIAWNCAFDQELVDDFPDLFTRLEKLDSELERRSPKWLTTMALYCYRKNRYDDAIQYAYESLKEKKSAAYVSNWLIIALCQAPNRQMPDRSISGFQSSAKPRKPEDTLALFQRWKQAQEQKLFAGERLSNDFEALNNTDFKFLIQELDRLRKK